MSWIDAWLVPRGFDAAAIDGVILRISLVLVIAWLAHASLARANPRWRVLVWRMVSVALLLVPLVTLFAAPITLAVLPVEPQIQVVRVEPLPAFESSPVADERHHEVLEAPRVATALDPPAVAAAPSMAPVDGPAAAAGNNWLWLGLGMWIVGAALGLLRDALSWVKLSTLRRRCNRIDPRIALLSATIAERLGCRQAFEVRETRDLNSPCVFGMLRPVILIPEADGTAERRHALPAILSHEIAHLAGGDVAWHGLLRLLSRLFWFHPLMWFVGSAHLAACDAVCDAVAANFVNDVAGYGQILAQLAMRMARPTVVPALPMARPSSVRRRIEALHRRLYSARLSPTAAALAVAAGLFLAGLCGALSLARATAAPAADEGLAVSGRILDELGQPIAGANVYVHSAGVRVGTSPYCPTCFPDCGKQATTAADGRFSLTGLDPTLVFQLLAVADAHRPAFIKKVDPRNAPDVTARLTARSIPNDSSRVVRGLVIGPHGTPARGAIVEPFGCQTAERRWWGRMEGIDPLVVTNQLGEFAIVCDAPVKGLDLKVEARGAARKNFERVPSGEASQRLVLQVGATVTGRLLDQGRPLAGASIGACQADRSAGKFLGPYQVDTDIDGRFALENLPSNGELYVYGVMKSLQGGGALPASKFMPSEGATTDLGDLFVAQPSTIRGRLVLADGKPIPPHTRVMFSRDKAWDSSFVEAAADGSFSIGGIPPEVINVYAQVKGYRLSPKNKSFEPLNGTSLKGLVSDNVENLVILYEPGQTIRPDYDRNFQTAAEKYKRLQTRPLVGVTATLEEFPAEKVNAAKPAAPAFKPLPKIVVPTDKPVPAAPQNGGPAVILDGSVVDNKGQQVDHGRLWLPVRWVSPFEFLTATGSWDRPGAFRLSFPKEWLPDNSRTRFSTVWAFAPQHAIGTGNAYKQMFGVSPAEPFKLELPPAGNLSFVVLLPDGQPARGAKVQPLDFKTPGAYEPVPTELAELASGTTDSSGRVALPALTRDGVGAINVRLPGYGTQAFRCNMKSTDPPERTLKLRAAGRLEGRIATEQINLARGMYVSIETTGLEQSEDLLRPTGAALVKVDEQGQFEIPEIAAGRVEIFAACDERLPVRPRLPERGALTLLVGETGTIEIPLEMAVRVHGVVRTKDTQKPLEGVRVSVRYGVGRQGDYVVTNERGEYTARALAGSARVQVISMPQGYLQMGEPGSAGRTIPTDVQDYQWPTIELVRTTQLTGKLLGLDGKPMPNVTIHGVVGNRRYGFGKTDENGAFTLSGAPEGIQLEKFGIWTRDEHFHGVLESKDPLVVQIKQ